MSNVDLCLILNCFRILTAHSALLSRKEMKSLEQSGSLKGSLGAEGQLSLISGCSDIREAVEGALHVQVSGDTCPPGLEPPASQLLGPKAVEGVGIVDLQVRMPFT